MKRNPYKISIITSTFNSENTLKDTVDSILNQSYSNIEYIVIDGASSDDTVEILKSSEKSFKDKNIEFYWKSESDSGIYSAWNKALKVVSGDWVIFIGSDDYFKSESILEEMIPYLIESEVKNQLFVYGRIEHINHQKQLIEESGKPWHQQKKRFTYTMNLGHSGAFHHKALFDKHGNFNESFKIVGDYEFLLRELKDKKNDARFVDKILVV
ncbi:MAG: glycosyltransferase, partial [Flavobacteriaceae bacterium]|nr:glycosyltransferase [Flavobacteriaceae bacterium]